MSDFPRDRNAKATRMLERPGSKERKLETEEIENGRREGIGRDDDEDTKASYLSVGKRSKPLEAFGQHAVATAGAPRLIYTYRDRYSLLRFIYILLYMNHSLQLKI